MNYCNDVRSSEFSKLSVFYALDCSRLKFNRALDFMVEQGVVEMCIQNGMPLYSLTMDDKIRGTILELAKFSLDHWFCL